MARVTSTMLDLGTPAPPFDLPDAAGVHHRLDDTAGAPVLVVMFICNHCPFVIHIARELGIVTQRMMAKGVAVVGINANDTDAYPDDAPEHMTPTARRYGWEFPYLIDADQTVAHAYRAACTPDFFVFDSNRRLVYRGQFDDSRPGNDTGVTGADLHRAVNAVLAGEPVASDQRPSMGCNIKWRPGNEPDWFG
jgi:peroxiredoxin